MTILKIIYNYFFGKDYTTVWKQFAEQENGMYILNGDDKVEFIYKNHTLEFESYTHYTSVGGMSRDTEYTKVIVEFYSPDKFSFILTPQGLVDNIGKLFGGQDIIVNDKQFDKKFIIKGNDEFKIQQLFSDNTIKKLLFELTPIRLEISSENGIFDEKVQEPNFMIYFLMEQKITSVDQLNKLSFLFKILIDTLTKLSSMNVKKASS